MITITQKGSFNNTEVYLRKLSQLDLSRVLNKYGNLGVNALSNATPLRTGLTAHSWYYTLVGRKGYYSIRWHNSHIEDGIPIAIILEYGHGTRTGGYVAAHPYIMQAIGPIFQALAEEAWREVSSI